jgi:hypothetical protein
MTFGYGQPLHGRELVWPCSVCDLQCADVLVTADHLWAAQDIAQLLKCLPLALLRSAP